MAELKIPYGEKNGRFYSPTEVPNGDKCGCVCPGCEQLLRANQGSQQSKRRAYFSHQVKADCVNGYETAVHKYAKQVIADELSLTLPEYTVAGDRLELPNGIIFRGETFKKEGERLSFERADVEKSVNLYRPDVTLHKDKLIFYIEICVTHPVGEEKAKFFENSNILEINLKELPRDAVFDTESFKEHVLTAASRKWIHCHLFDQELGAYKELFKQRSQEAYEKAKRDMEVQRQRELQRQQASESYQRNKAFSRAKYDKELAELQQLNTHTGMMERIEYLSQTSSENIAQVASYLNQGGEIPFTIMEEHPGSWIFNVHWIVWQAYIYAQFIQKAEIGSVISAFEIKRRVVKRYGVIDCVSTLNQVKQEQKTQGKKRRKYYADVGAWFLTDEENRRIVSPFRPVISFILSLENMEMLERKESNSPNLFVVKQSCIETARQLQREKHRKLTLLKIKQRKASERAEKKRIEQIALERAKSDEEAAKKRAEIEQRNEEKIRIASKRLRELYEKGVRHAKRCSFCAGIFDPMVRNCPSCGKAHFEPVELSQALVDSIEHRLRCDPRMSNFSPDDISDS